MEKEVSKLFNLALILIAIAVVIGMGFTIFGSGKAVANTGTNNVVSSIQTINDGMYDEYDNTTISGLMVKSGINKLITEDKAVLLHTNSMDVDGKFKEVPAEVYGVQLDDTEYINIGKLLGESEQLEVKDNKLEKDHTFKNKLSTDDRFVYAYMDAKDQSVTSIKQINEDKGLMVVQDTDQYECSIIKNAIGDICGVMFTQLVVK